MKISRQSWHYKIRDLGDGWPPYNDDLCRYFWSVVYKITLLLVIIVILSSFIYMFFTSSYLIEGIFVFLFALSSIILTRIAVVFIRKRFGHGHPIGLSKENLIIEYLKAKKRKVCPLIDYVD